MLTRPKGGDRAPSLKSLWDYQGSKEGQRTLARLDLVKCQCGVTNMVDDSPTALTTRCRGCGTIVV